MEALPARARAIAVVDENLDLANGVTLSGSYAVKVRRTLALTLALTVALSVALTLAPNLDVSPPTPTPSVALGLTREPNQPR